MFGNTELGSAPSEARLTSPFVSFLTTSPPPRLGGVGALAFRSTPFFFPLFRSSRTTSMQSSQ